MVFIESLQTRDVIYQPYWPYWHDCSSSGSSPQKKNMSHAHFLGAFSPLLNSSCDFCLKNSGSHWPTTTSLCKTRIFWACFFHINPVTWGIFLCSKEPWPFYTFLCIFFWVEALRGLPQIYMSSQVLQDGPLVASASRGSWVTPIPISGVLTRISGVRNILITGR